MRYLPHNHEEDRVKKTHDLSPHFTPQDLADRLGIPLNTVYYWRNTGQGPKGFRVGKHVRWRLEEVEAWECEQLAKESA
jgi:predicted DNA-binding transcriptional regulator AlpA